MLGNITELQWLSKCKLVKQAMGLAGISHTPVSRRRHPGRDGCFSLPTGINQKQFSAVHRTKAGKWGEEQPHRVQATNTIFSCCQNNPEFSFGIS